MQHSLELLAPARDLQTARAAIAAGADAIFIGGPSFGARAAAANSLEDLQSLCAYAHRFGVRIHLTLNTLLYDAEINAAQELIHAAAQVGIDAIIVQDPAVFTLDVPAGIELHASTQCNIDNVDKLKFYRDLGCAQAVLPRELSLEEMAAFHQACPDIRLEAFVAGALCVGQSGICYISEFINGRSANRGACAQICRLPMQLLDPNGRVIKEGHLLSLKDNLALYDLPELIAAGISSFKIEGRLKDTIYVKNQCAAFSQALDSYIAQHPAYVRSSHGRCCYNFVPAPGKTFNRGFTAAYLQGSNDNLYADKSPKFVGEPCAVCLQCFPRGRGSELRVKLQPEIELHNGDAFTFFDQNGELTGFRANEVQQQGLNARLLLHSRLMIQPGCAIARNLDIEFERSTLAKDSAKRQLSLCISVSFYHERCEITYADELGRQASASLKLTMPKTVQAATDLNMPGSAKALTKRVIAEKCARCPDPDFLIEQVEIIGEELAFLPVSALNELRRKAFNAYLVKAQAYRPNGQSKAFALPDPLPLFPETEVDSRLVLNQKSRDFYLRCGAQIKSTGSEQVLMVCRNCLIKNYALCSKDGGKVSGFKLRIGKRLFALRCRCSDCRMLVLTTKGS